jgi:hypothetical protein
MRKPEGFREIFMIPKRAGIDAGGDFLCMEAISGLTHLAANLMPVNFSLDSYRAPTWAAHLLISLRHG